MFHSLPPVDMQRILLWCRRRLLSTMATTPPLDLSAFHRKRPTVMRGATFKWRFPRTKRHALTKRCTTFRWSHSQLWLTPTTKWHQIISFIKSGIRIVGYAIIPFDLVAAAIVLIFSEVIGIIEELV